MSILAETANKVPMDDKDYKILDELQKDGRITNQELSERVNLSATPCLRRVRILEEAGIIRGYCAVVDQKALGLAVTAFIRIRLERHDDETVQGVEKAISNMPEVMDCWLMTGQWVTRCAYCRLIWKLMRSSFAIGCSGFRASPLLIRVLHMGA